MNKPTTITRGRVALLAGALALGVVATASKPAAAQPSYRRYNHGYYGSGYGRSYRRSHHSRHRGYVSRYQVGRDADLDGVPNWRDGDIDNDGVRNRWDRDMDNDGVPNRYDRYPHNPRRR